MKIAPRHKHSSRAVDTDRICMLSYIYMRDTDKPGEFISGPGSLDEYLGLKTHYLAEEIQKYQSNQSAFSSQQAEMGIITQKMQGELDQANQARDALLQGNKEPGLNILREEISGLIERIRFNKEQEAEDIAIENNATLVVLQMLLAEESGVQPEYLGYSESRHGEAYFMPENVRRSDLVNATLYKAMMAFGSHNPPASGYSPTPDTVSPGYVINRLLSYDCGLSVEEKSLLIQQLSTIGDAIKHFAQDKFKYRYEWSIPRFPGSNLKPQQLIIYHSYSKISESPNATFYIEGNQVKCRYSRDKKKTEQVFDISQPPDGISVETVADIGELPAELQDKILDIFRSDEFRANWEQLAPRTKIPEALSY